MTKQLFAILLLTLLPYIAISQTTVRGFVYDMETKKPLEGVVVTILNEQNEALGYDISTDKGAFNFSIQIQGEKTLLTCRMLGYKDEIRTVKNTSDQLNIYMLQTSIELKEVVIKAQPITISEDTLKYRVNAFKSLGDRTIGDVLKRLPGIEVSESGRISYKGESINRFYIEGLDLLQSRYGIATNNIPAEVVTNVEVIENHQPVKSIKGMVASSQAAINLKLKTAKMVKPIGGIRAGSGYSNDFNWLLEAFALRASRQKQTIAMYKTNNVGDNIGVELTEQNISVKGLQDDEANPGKNILSPSSSIVLPIEEERYLFNRPHIASLNNLWKISEDNQIRFNMNYKNDRLTENSYAISEYFLDGSSLKVII